MVRPRRRDPGSAPVPVFPGAGPHPASQCRRLFAHPALDVLAEQRTEFAAKSLLRTGARRRNLEVWLCARLELRPWWQIRTIGIAGFREIRPVALHDVGQASVNRGRLGSWTDATYTTSIRAEYVREFRGMCRAERSTLRRDMGELILKGGMPRFDVPHGLRDGRAPEGGVGAPLFRGGAVRRVRCTDIQFQRPFSEGTIGVGDRPRKVV